MPTGDFYERIEDIRDYVKSSKAAEGFDEVLIRESLKCATRARPANVTEFLWTRQPGTPL